jgi:hypothetical protein
MAGRKARGHVSILREAFYNLNHSHGLHYGTRFGYVSLAVYVNHKTGASEVFLIRDFAEWVNVEEHQARRWIKALDDTDLIHWTPASNRDVPGQLVLPGYDWFTSERGATPTLVRHQSDTGAPNTAEQLADDVQEQALRNKKSRSQEVDLYANRGSRRGIEEQELDESGSDMPVVQWPITPVQWNSLEALVLLNREAPAIEVQYVTSGKREAGTRKQPYRLDTVRDALDYLVDFCRLAVEVRPDLFIAVPDAADVLADAEETGR